MDMTFSNFIIIFLLIFYTRYTLSLFNKKNRVQIKHENIELNKLRKIPFKTVEEQKKFINIKYGKKDINKKKEGFNFFAITDFIENALIYIMFYFMYIRLFDIFNINMNFWFAIIFIIFFPLGFNLFFSYIGLQKKNDIGVFFKW